MTQRKKFRLSQSVAALASCFLSANVMALPTGGQVANGSATMTQNGSVLAITNSNGAIINWQGFSIGLGETVRFIQPSAVSSVLNRVVTADPSVLLGQMQSNGQVFLINPAGILVGAGARIDVAAFVASSLQMSDADFLAKRFIFQDTPGVGLVRNEGTISTPTGGRVYLVAPKVENAGLIQSAGGEVILAAGQTVEIGDTATPGVRVEVTGTSAEATNIGSVLADAGRIGLVGAVVKNTGTLSASSAVADGGRIFLRASGIVTNSGQITASSAQGAGGQIDVLGDKVGILAGANLDTSGATAGGTIRVGGDYQGANAAIQNARISYVDRDATLRADATIKGDGGKVIVWADDTTRAYGTISARGGAQGGDGGFVETSGKKSLDFDARVDTSAAFGKTGQLLLDPNSVTILNGPASNLTGDTWAEAAGGSTFSWSSINTQLATTNVTISTTDSGTGDDIIFSNAYGAMAASAGSTNRLILDANDNVVFNTGVDLKGGLQVTAGGGVTVNSIVRSAGNMSITAGAGLNIGYAGATSESRLEMFSSSGSQTISLGGQLVLQGSNGSGTAALLKSSGTQTITAGSISLTGGTGATGDNGARIKADGNQTITTSGTGALTLQGGSGSTNNEAMIESTGATQQVTVGGAMTLTAGSSGGAIVAAPQQTITVSGNLALTGGSGTVTGDYNMAAAAAIGYDDGANLTLNVTGSVVLTGSNSLNPAMIGAAAGTGTVSLRGASVLMNAYSFLGNWNQTYSAGSVTVRATAGGISQAAASANIMTNSLVAEATGAIDLAQSVYATNIDLYTSGTGNISLKALSPTTHLTRLRTNNGTVTATNSATNGNFGLGDITATGAVNITAAGAILDDNASGVANITAPTIVLNSTNGNASGLAISADVVTTAAGSVTATAGGSSQGGIRIESVGTNAPSTLTLTNNTGNLSFKQQGDLTTSGSNYQFNSTSGSATFGATGDVNVNGGALSLPAGGLTIQAGNALNLTSNLSASVLNLIGSDILVDGANLTATSGKVSVVGQNLLVRNSGVISSSNGNIEAAIAQDLKLQNGGTLTAAGDIKLILKNATSKIVLNDTTGLAASKITASSAGSRVLVDFLNREADGVIIDGLLSKTTPAGSSGFYANAAPAIDGVGLRIVYGVVPAVSVLLTDLLSLKMPASNASTVEQLVSTVLASAEMANPSLSGTTSGESADEFGGGTATGGNNEAQKRNVRRAALCR